MPTFLLCFLAVSSLAGELWRGRRVLRGDPVKRRCVASRCGGSEHGAETSGSAIGATSVGRSETAKKPGASEPPEKSVGIIWDLTTVGQNYYGGKSKEVA